MFINLTHNENKKLKAVIFCGPSGSGKGTSTEYVLSLGIPFGFSISATTRPKREQEKHGREYLFITKKDFEEKIKNNEFVEYEKFYDQCYGTLKSEIARVLKENKIILFDVDVKGAVRLKEYFGDDSIIIFIAPPSIKEAEKRIRAREKELSEETIEKRVGRIPEEMTYQEKADYIVVNDKLEETKKSLYEIMQLHELL